MKLFSETYQNGFTYLEYNITPETKVDDIELSMLANNSIDGLVPVVVNTFNENRTLKYNVTGLQSLKEYINGETNREKTLQLLNSITDTILSCEEYFISEESLLADIEYIYINKDTREVVMICFPVEEETNNNVKSLFENIIRNEATVYDMDEDLEYVNSILEYLKKNKSVDLNAFKKLIISLAPEFDEKLIEKNRQEREQKKRRLQDIMSDNSSKVDKVLSVIELGIDDSPLGKINIPNENVNFDIPGQSQEMRYTTKSSENDSDHSGSDDDSSSFFGRMKESRKQKKIEKQKQKQLKKEQKQIEKQKKKEAAEEIDKKIDIPSQDVIDSESPSNNSEIIEIKRNQFSLSDNEQKEEPGKVTEEKSTEFEKDAGLPKFKEIQKIERDFENKVSKNEEIEKPVIKIIDRPIIIAETDESEGTCLLEETVLLVDNQPKIVPIINRCKTGEEIIIDKDEFRIGHRKAYADYYIGDNQWISRAHAKVLKREDGYYIVDTNSKNHTYINDERLIPEKEYLLEDGMILRLANEDFVFTLKEE